jgi:hypothetical protein
MEPTILREAQQVELMKGNPAFHDSTRRQFLRSTMLAAAAGGAATALVRARPARAVTRLSRDTVKYQDKPKGKDSCATCMHYIPAKSAKANGTCAIVDGPISPAAWCVAFVVRS